MNDPNFLYLAKDGEAYVFSWDDNRTTDVLRTMGRWASNPELSFTWYDAARLAKTVRESSKERPNERKYHARLEDI